MEIRAGLGIIEKINLLITPEFGPRILLRGFLTEAPLNGRKSIFDSSQPCHRCPVPFACVRASSTGALKDISEGTVGKHITEASVSDVFSSPDTAKGSGFSLH
ncbi:MAG: hypothetical protein ACTSVI_03705 [Promethearchaeota archaeon]